MRRVGGRGSGTAYNGWDEGWATETVGVRRLRETRSGDGAGHLRSKLLDTVGDLESLAKGENVDLLEDVDVHFEQHISRDLVLAELADHGRLVPAFEAGPFDNVVDVPLGGVCWQVAQCVERLCWAETAAEGAVCVVSSLVGAAIEVAAVPVPVAAPVPVPVLTLSPATDRTLSSAAGVADPTTEEASTDRS